MNLPAEEGLYPDQQALFRDALRTLLRSRPELRIQLALIMYKHGRISLSRAAEIAGTDLESLKEFLRETGTGHAVPSVGKADGDEIGHLKRWVFPRLKRMEFRQAQLPDRRLSYQTAGSVTRPQAQLPDPRLNYQTANRATRLF